jgi:hypothetical protein
MESNLAKQVLEKQVFENGMKIYEIPIEKRTEKICINAMKWALESKTITCTAEERQAIMFGIMNCFPKELLLFSFVRTHLLK